MEEISISKIAQSKVLKFDIFDMAGNKIFPKGEILTPGKIMKIKEYMTVFKKESETDLLSDVDEMLLKNELKDAINHDSIFSPSEQRELINDYNEILTLAKEKKWDSLLKETTFLRDIMLKLLGQSLEGIKYSHQIKLIGDINIVHPLNVAFYSSLLATKLEMSDIDVANVTLGALLHDIGKVQVPIDALNNPKKSKSNNLMYQSHTILGYKILKNNLKLSTETSRIALEHHEMMDGSGFPYGISSICNYAQIVTVCNVFDNSSTSLSVDKNPMFSNVMKELLKLGSKVFSPKALYTFVHMFNYSDTITYWDLLNDEY